MESQKLPAVEKMSVREDAGAFKNKSNTKKKTRTKKVQPVMEQWESSASESEEECEDHNYHETTK